MPWQPAAVAAAAEQTGAAAAAMMCDAVDAAAATAAAFAREIIHKIPHVATTVNDSPSQETRNRDNPHTVSPPLSQYSRDYESYDAGDVGSLVSEDRVYSFSEAGHTGAPIPTYMEQRTLTQGAENASTSQPGLGT